MVRISTLIRSSYAQRSPLVAQPELQGSLAVMVSYLLSRTLIGLACILIIIMKGAWNAKLRFDTTAPQEVAARAKDHVLANIYPERPHVDECAPNTLERRAITVIGSVLRDLLHDLHLNDIPLPPERIHIVSERTLARLGHAEAAGVVLDGHVYILRTANRGKFYHSLTHEAAHATASCRLWVEQSSGDEYRLQFIQDRGGLTFLQRTAKNNPYYRRSLDGLNEGVTELIGHALRQRLIMRSGLGLTLKEATDLSHSVSYWRWVILVDALIRVVANEAKESFAQVRDEVFRDYFVGRQRFLKRLELCKKGAVKTLLPLDSSDDAALKAAHALGMVELTARMKARP